MNIENKIVEPCNNYTFSHLGNHIVYVLLQNNTSLNYMFHEVKSLISIDFSEKFNTENKTDMNNMFNGCLSLTSINLTYFNTKNVKNMENLFYFCQSLQTIEYNFNTENVINMKNMFNGCRELKRLNLSNFNTKKVTDMTGMIIKKVI